MVVLGYSSNAMLTPTIIACVICQTAIAVYLLTVSKVESDFEKNLYKLLLVLLGHLCTKFFFIAVLHNLIIYERVMSGFGLSYGPLLFILTMAYLQKPLTRRQIFRHLFPFIFFTGVYIASIIALLTNVISVELITTYNEYYLLLVGVSFFIYPFVVKRILRRSPAERDTMEGKLIDSIANVFMVGMTAGLIFTFIHVFNFNIRFFDLRIIPYACFTAIPVLILRYKFGKSKIEATAREGVDEQAMLTLAKQPEEKRYQKSSLDQVTMDRYEMILMSYMDDHKVYLDTELSLESLSQKIKMPKHHLTQVLNDRLKKSFYRFVNEYRISDAVEKLKDVRAEVNILSLAYDCGFNSKSSFNNYFKQLTGHTPSAYRKMVIDGIGINSQHAV